MDLNIIFDFLKDLKPNNNREWFNEHKDRYLQAKSLFENITESLIVGIGKFDKEIKGVQLKDCIFRIYRDTRFAYDKTPYKTHFGAYIAAKGGRKSEYGGYYLHFDPEGSFLSVGAWMPDPKLLKMLRLSVYENLDEFKEIIQQKDFVKYFGTNFYEEDMLKTVPREFPKDFKDNYFLRLKHYLVNHDFTESELQNPDFIQFTSIIAKSGFPLNKFLNYTVDDFLGK